MKKTLLLFLLLPFLTFAQNDLARWNAATMPGYTPAVAANVTPLDITTNGGVSITYVSYNSESTFFQTGNWPVPQQIGSAYDVNKYIQFRIKPADKYKIDVNTFTFQCRSGSGKFKVRYSKNANFETGVKDLILETTTPGNWTTYTTTLSPDFNPILENEYIYIRIYSYSTNNTFEIKTGTLATNVVPVINGSVSPFDSSKIMAVKDFADTKINVAANINLLANDIQKQNVTTLTLSTPPNALEGTAIINPDKSITFNPAKDFVGTSTFSYTISNGTETSTSTVKVTVSSNPDNVLSLWNGAGDSFNPVTNSYVNPNSPVTSVGATLKYTFYNTDNAFFETGNWPKPEQNGGKEDPGKYVQFKINPDSKHKLTLKQFNFTYRANGQRFLVKYSKDPNFTAGVLTMITDTPTASNWTSLTNNINPSVNPILSNETLYIRIYSYSSNNNFEIKNGNGNSEGPVITGTVDDVYTLTANNDYVSTPSNKPIDINILANDVVSSTYPLHSISFTQPSNGTVTIDATHKITFTPNANFTGSATFTYTLRNTNSPSDYSSATVIVNATAPVCTVQGDQTTYGDNKWIGYVYKYPTDNPVPTIAYNATPDPTVATYVGTVTEDKNFDRNVNNGAITGVTSNFPCGTAPSDFFLVRYKMRTKVTETGFYNFMIASDDAIRLYVDNKIVLQRWTGGSYAVNSTLYELKADQEYEFTLEYYELGGAARASFSFGLPKGDPTVFGDKVWNVYGYNKSDITLQNVVYAGYYVDPNPNANSTAFWTTSTSPYTASNWQGAPMPNDYFTVVSKRQGFVCGKYQIQVANYDDDLQIYVDGTKVFDESGNTDNSVTLDNNGLLFALNSKTKVEIRLKENGGGAKSSVFLLMFQIMEPAMQTAVL